MQFPQPAQRSDHTPNASVTPRKVVLHPGKTTLSGKRSAKSWTPAPHAKESMASHSDTSSSIKSTNSGSHCLAMASSTTSPSSPEVFTTEHQKASAALGHIRNLFKLLPF